MEFILYLVGVNKVGQEDANRLLFRGVAWGEVWEIEVDRLTGFGQARKIGTGEENSAESSQGRHLSYQFNCPHHTADECPYMEKRPSA